MLHDNLKNPALVGRSRLILFLLDSDMRILSATTPVESLLGFPPADLVGQLFRDLGDSDCDPFLEKLRTARVSEPVSSEDVHLRTCETEEVVPVTIKGQRLDDHETRLQERHTEAEYLISVCTRSNGKSDSGFHILPFDVLPGSEGVLLFEALSDTILVPLYVNDVYEKLSGYNENELSGLCRELLGGLKPRAEITSRISEAVQNEQSLEETCLLSRRDGSTFWADLRFEPLRSVGEERSLFMVTVRDVTERKKRQAALARAEQQVKDAKLVQEIFLSSMSHEIRTPMSGIIGMAELLSMGDLSDDQREKLDTLIRSARALTRIMNDIQFYSDLESDRVPLYIRPFKLEEVLDRIREIYEPIAQEKQIHFQIERESSIPEKLAGDEARLEQVMTRLLDNAFKFTDHGSIHLRMKLLEDTGDVIRIKVQVEDSGIGVPGDMQSALFEKFAKGAEMSAKYSGIGLGLAITRKLAGLMDAVVDIDSTPGEGTIIELVIPFGRGETVTAPDMPAADDDTDVGVADFRKELLTLVTKYLKSDAPEDPVEESVATEFTRTSFKPRVLKEMVAEDETMMLELMDLFLEQTPGLLENLENGAESEDWDLVIRMAHKLKPTLRYMGMERAYELAVELELSGDLPDAGGENGKDKVTELIRLIRQGLDEVREEANKIRF